MIHPARYVRTNHRMIMLRATFRIRFTSREYATLPCNIIKYFYPVQAKLKNVVKRIKMFCKRLHNSDLFVLLPSKSATKACLLTEYKITSQTRKGFIQLKMWLLSAFWSLTFCSGYRWAARSLNTGYQHTHHQERFRNKGLNTCWLSGNFVSCNQPTEENNA